MSNIIKNIICHITRKSVPELSILKQELNWNAIANSFQNVTIEKNVRLYPTYHICDSKIGKYTYISYNSYISKTNIGKFCSIGPNFLCGWGIHPTNGLSTSPSFYSQQSSNGIAFSKTNKIEERKPITIGNDVFIGSNVTILDGVTIGDGAVIGAGAVVSKDIPPYAIAVGCPIKIIRYRFNPEQIEALLKIKWWDFDEERLSDVEKHFFDIDGFIARYLQADDKARPVQPV